MLFDYDDAKKDGAPDFTGGPGGGPHRWQQIVELAPGTSLDSTDKAKIQCSDTQKDYKNQRYAFVTRELFLLVKGNFSQPNQYVCPSSTHEADDLRADKSPRATTATSRASWD